MDNYNDYSIPTFNVILTNEFVHICLESHIYCTFRIYYLIITSSYVANDHKSIYNLK